MQSATKRQRELIPQADGDRTARRLGWFNEARFGLFVHWGLYSVLARHEQVMDRESIPAERYEELMEFFEADRFDPSTWARTAKDAGMGYAVLTAKHHDGFCLWDTQTTTYSAPNAAAGRDLVRGYVDAFREEGLRVGFYYSLLDWHHPDFLVDGRHPLGKYREAHELNVGRDMDRYRSYMREHIRELLTNYGPIDYLFFDFSYHGSVIWGGKGPAEWGAEELLALVRELQPDCLVNDRLGIRGDLVTPEQIQPSGPAIVDGRRLAWEACQTMNVSWGYDRDNHDFKSPQLLVRMLIDSVSLDGNMLLNVGPDARGHLTPNDSGSLAEIGGWMAEHGKAIVGAGMSEEMAPDGVRYTQRGDRLYAHLYYWPHDELRLPGLLGRVKHAQFLHDGSHLRHEDYRVKPGTYEQLYGSPDPTVVTITLPSRRPDVLVPVIEIFMHGKDLS